MTFTENHRHKGALTCKGAVYTLLREDGGKWNVAEVLDWFKRNPETERCRWSQGSVQNAIWQLIDTGRVASSGSTGGSESARYWATAL